MKENFQSLLNEDKPVLVDFFAEWCGPCKVQAPVLKEVKSEIGDSARIIKIDVDKMPAIAQAYQISGVPTLILFRNGRPVWQQSGVASKKQLVDLIKQHV
jgi:thioredoxin 1